MEIDRDDHEAVSPTGGQKWFASSGIGNRGQTVTLNFLADSKEEVAPLAYGLGIAHNIHMHEQAQEIGTADDYRDMSK